MCCELLEEQHPPCLSGTAPAAVDSCYVAPANVPEVISVAASNLATKYTGSKTGDTEDMYKVSAEEG